MGQYNINRGVDNNGLHPQIKGKKINKNYYGSELNQFVAIECRKDMVVNNIDLIINDYKNNYIRIIESKHTNEKLSTGQRILLKKLSSIGINTYVIFGDQPYDEVTVYSFQTDTVKHMNKNQLIDFLNNK